MFAILNTLIASVIDNICQVRNWIILFHVSFVAAIQVVCCHTSMMSSPCIILNGEECDATIDIDLETSCSQFFGDSE